MTASRNLVWILAVLAALLVGGLAGVWLGGEMEQDVLADVFARADLTADCRAQIGRSMQQLIDDYEGSDLGP